MILHCSYEELAALKQGVRTLLEGEGVRESAILAPPEVRVRLETFLRKLEGDLSVATLAEQRAVVAAVEAIVQCLRAQMESLVAASHPADEGAVAAYFDFAHALLVINRVREIGREMEAMIEVVTGRPPTPETIETFRFPD